LGGRLDNVLIDRHSFGYACNGINNISDFIFFRHAQYALK